MVVTKEQWVRLDTAAHNLRKADDEFRAICREIGSLDETPDPPSPPPGPPHAGPPAPAANLTRPPKSRVGPGAPSYTSGKVRFHPGIRIQCASCGEVVEGAREKDGKYFPYRHRQRDTDTTCGGTQLPGRRVDPNPSPNPGG